MKKLLFTIACILTLGTYDLLERQPAPESGPDATVDPGIAASPAVTPAPGATTSSGQYADGSYTGSSVSTQYGPIQVRATIAGGELTDVQALKLPGDRTSRQINDQALPLLTSAAIRSQSAQVDRVTGATITSRAFVESLTSALRQAAPQ